MRTTSSSSAKNSTGSNGKKSQPVPPVPPRVDEEAADSPVDSKTASDSLYVPEDVAQDFPDYVTLIKGSESMKDEERQYWVDTLPIMTEEQLQNLRDILLDEKKQLRSADRDYAKGVEQDVKRFDIDFNEEKHKEKKRLLMQMETEHEKKETVDEAILLKEIESMDV